MADLSKVDLCISYEEARLNIISMQEISDNTEYSDQVTMQDGDEQAATIEVVFEDQLTMAFEG